MKRNIVPLLGIAFVVAIVSTGAFYGLFAGKLRSTSSGPGRTIVVAARNLDRGTVIQAADLRTSELKGTLQGAYSKPEEAVGVTLLEAVQQNEPLLSNRVANRDARSRSGVPKGMRALSIRVSESTGVVGLLHAGSRVDVQAVSDRGVITELRTILQNVEVLAVGSQLEPVGGNRPPAPVVTVLAYASDADAVALADSGARVRLTLRNPIDDDAAPRKAMALASLFQSAGTIAVEAVRTPPKQAEPARTQSSALAPERSIQLQVQVLSTSRSALGELNSKVDVPETGDTLRVAAFRSDTNAGELIRKLQEKQEVEIVSASRLTAALGRPASLRAGVAPCRLRVEFSEEADSRGKLNLRVKPEISLQRGEGIETHKYDAGVPDGNSFLVTGLFSESKDRKALEGLYPGHSWSGRELVIVVTPQSHRVPANAVAEAHRGQ